MLVYKAYAHHGGNDNYPSGACLQTSNLSFLYQLIQDTLPSKDMENILEQIRALYANANANERQHIQEQLRDVQRDIASNFDLVWSLGSGVGTT